MDLKFTEEAWEDYLYWSQNHKENFKKINSLIKECQRTPFEGMGKPEPLKHNMRGYWSRRINQEHRLVYKVIDGTLVIVTCRYHY
jgi:toxin YoeB